MMFAVLEFMDFFIITLLILIFAGGSQAVAKLRKADRARFDRLEQKLDLLLTNAGVAYATPANWKLLADQGPENKIAAIKAYRDETGAGLAEAKQAVEEYLAGRGN